MKDINKIGHKALTAVQDIGLLVVALATVIAIGFEIAAMIGELRGVLAAMRMALLRGAAEIRLLEVIGLNDGAHGAVEDEDPFL